MPSIFKRPKSPFYFCSYRAHDGRWLKKSTKRKNRSDALKVCMAWEEAAQGARDHNLTAAQARKVLAEMVKHSSGESLTTYTLEGWLSEWEKIKAGSASKSTMLRYSLVMRDFKKSLGERAKAPLASITAGDITKFRDTQRSEGRAVSTCNLNARKNLSVPFEAARKLGYISVNPVSGVDLLKEEGQKKKKRSFKEPFAPGEVAALVRHAKDEWKGAIILGATTGLRLGDVVSLKWANINRATGFITVETIKTGEELNLPIHADFETYLDGLQEGIGNAPVFPELISRKINGRAGLSRQFRGVMEKAGIKEKSIAAAGNAGRTRFSKGFHSLRHSFTSVLANKNVSAEVRQRLTGHKDDITHQGYTNIEMKTRKAAVKKIPSVLGK